jgi:hypothetical protein
MMPWWYDAADCVFDFVHCSMTTELTIMKATSILGFAVLTLLSVPTSTLAESFGTGANQFTIDFVLIGNPDNRPDTSGDPNPAGSVPYVYRMGKYEVSRDMVAKASDAGNLGISLDPMTVVAGGPRPNMPGTGVTWNEAARFVNWLNSSQGFPQAYKFSTQPGDTDYDASENILLWQLGDIGYNPTNRFRNSLARYFLPSAHEWYKSAYYDPDGNGGNGGYWDFPTGSDSAPTPVDSGTIAGTAVYRQTFAQGPADVTEAGGLSPFGAMGLGGNVLEWEETDRDLINDDPRSLRATRGGDFETMAPSEMSALDHKHVSNPTSQDLAIGFRVASIPEPNSLLLGSIGTALLLFGKRLPVPPVARFQRRNRVSANWQRQNPCRRVASHENAPGFPVTRSWHKTT